MENVSAPTTEKPDIVAVMKMEETEKISEDQLVKFKTESNRKIKEYNDRADEDAKTMKEGSESYLKQLKKEFKDQRNKYNDSINRFAPFNKDEKASKELEKLRNLFKIQKAQYDRGLDLFNKFENLTGKQKQAFSTSLELQKKQYEATDELINKIEQQSASQLDTMNLLTQTIQNASQQQLQYVDTVSNELSTLKDEQTKSFHSFSEDETSNFKKFSDGLRDFASGQVSDFKKNTYEQSKLLRSVSSELKNIRISKKQETENLDTFADLIAEGFTVLQNRSDRRLDRIEERIESLHETNIFLNYEREVTLRLRDVHDAYIIFMKSMSNITRPKISGLAYQMLLKQCCDADNSPMSIVATIHSKVFDKRMEQGNMFQSIYSNYFGKNSRRMLNLYLYVISDLYRALQYTAICDKVTNGYGNGVEKASKGFLIWARFLNTVCV